MNTSTIAHLPTPVEIEQAKQSSRTLSKYSDAERVELVLRGSNGETDSLMLPKPVVQLLLDLLAETAKGNAISLMPMSQEICTQEAATLLNVSRPFLVGLLEKHEIPFRKVGAHRRVVLKDVMDYKERIDRRRSQALDQLAAISLQPLADNGNSEVA